MIEKPRRSRRRILDTAVEDEATVRRAATAASVGNVAEWYDFGIYSYLAAVVLNRVFFPDAGQWSLVLTLAAFAAAFVARSFGGFAFGHLGDRLGRPRVPAATVLLMTVATVLLGLVPSHGTIGIAAPVLVVVIRMLQGFSAGGEYTGALSLVAEYAPDRRRGFFGSWLEFGTIVGYSLGAGVTAVLVTFLPDDDLLAWGWRIPFLLALPLGIAGVYLRMRLEDTPGLPAAHGALPGAGHDDPRPRVRDLVKRYRSAALVTAGPVIAWNVTNYVLTTYVPTYLTGTLPRYGQAGTGREVATLLQVGVTVLALAAVVLVGRWSDRIGRRPLLAAGSIGLVVLGLPIVWLLQTGLAGQATGLVLLAAILVCFAGVRPSTLPARFPTLIRYAGLGLTFNLAVSLFAGTAPAVIEAAVTATGNLDRPGYYLIGAGVIGLVSVWFLAEPSGLPLPGAAPLGCAGDVPEAPGAAGGDPGTADPDATAARTSG